MAASYQAIQSWLEEAKATGARWLIVVCDTYDYEDYPVAIKPDEDFWAKFAEFNGNNMQRVMEVYDLEMDLKSQLDEQNAFHTPAR